MYVTQKRIFVVFVFKTTYLKNKIKSTLINQFVYRYQALIKRRTFVFFTSERDAVNRNHNWNHDNGSSRRFLWKYVFKCQKWVNSKLQTSITKKTKWVARSHGLVVKEDGSWPWGRGFKPLHCLDECKRFASYYNKEILKIKVAEWGTPNFFFFNLNWVGRALLI